MQQRALVLSGGITGVLGLGFAAAAVVAPDLLLDLYRLVAAPGTSVDLGASARLATGIYGGLMAGWGALMFGLGRVVDVPRAAATGILTWYVVDSAASIATGFPWNALSNAAFLVPSLPLLMSLGRRTVATSRSA